jgi:hypothetical protein
MSNSCAVDPRPTVGEEDDQSALPAPVKKTDDRQADKTGDRT